MKTRDLLTPLLDAIESRLCAIIPVEEGSPHAVLFQAARHSLLAPAKRMRPLLTLAVLGDFDCPLKYGIDPACAIEMIHTYSLIHDDLPCMDDDSLRRGQPALHTIYGEAQAILTGDYLCTYAFEVLAQAPHLLEEKKNTLIHYLASRGGSEGMVGGQVIDMCHKQKPINAKTLECMFAKKTAALLAVALEFGAIIADLDDTDQKHLKKAGQLLGMGYQYADDHLDWEKSQNALDPISISDEHSENTFPQPFHSTRQSQQKAQLYYRKALAELRGVSRPIPRTSLLFQGCIKRLETNETHDMRRQLRT